MSSLDLSQVTESLRVICISTCFTPHESRSIADTNTTNSEVGIRAARAGFLLVAADRLLSVTVTVAVVTVAPPPPPPLPAARKREIASSRFVP